MKKILSVIIFLLMCFFVVFGIGFFVRFMANIDMNVFISSFVVGILCVTIPVSASLFALWINKNKP